jgi:hypothetical protein
MKITAILASLAIVATGAAAQVEEAAFNLGHYIKHNVIGISEEEAFKLGHYIAHNVVGVSEEEDMSLAEMAKRFKKIKPFIPVAEEEEEAVWVKNMTPQMKHKLMTGVHTPHLNLAGISEEEAMSLIEMGKRFNKIRKFIPLSQQEEEEEEAMSLKTMLDRYNKIKKFIPLSEEEEAMNLKTMFNRYNKIKKFIPAEEEENMSLKTMLNRYNKIKKFIPLSEEEEAINLKTFFDSFREAHSTKRGSYES